MLKLSKFAHLRDNADFPQVITQCLNESYSVLYGNLQKFTSIYGWWFKPNYLFLLRISFKIKYILKSELVSILRCEIELYTHFFEYHTQFTQILYNMSI